MKKGIKYIQLLALLIAKDEPHFTEVELLINSIVWLQEIRGIFSDSGCPPALVEQYAKDYIEQYYIYKSTGL